MVSFNLFKPYIVNYINEHKFKFKWAAYSHLVSSSALVIQKFKFVVVGSGPSVNATSNNENSGSIDGKADGIR